MSLLTPEELREIRRLHIQAGRKVDAMFAGDYRSAVRGRGMEFEEVRAYAPGDDIRHIDWNVTARTGEPFLKVFREERQLSVVLAVDVSGSARVGSGGHDGRTDRRLQLARIAGGLAYASSRNRDKVGLVTFSDKVEHFITPRNNRAHVWGIIQAVYEGGEGRPGTDVGEALGFIARTQKRRGTVIVISDFLDARPWDRTLGALSRKHTVHAICVTDPLDEGLGQLGLVEIIDSETGRTQLIDSATWSGKYSAQARLERLRRTGAKAFTLSTGDDVFTVLHRAFQSRRGRR